MKSEPGGAGGGTLLNRRSTLNLLRSRLGSPARSVEKREETDRALAMCAVRSVRYIEDIRTRPEQPRNRRLDPRRKVISR